MTDIEKIKQQGKATSIFYFKQFWVKDDRSTMKVGTDAVLLGISVDTAGAAEILEIGTGSGVIALILAQRSSATIDAIDIDAESVMQARENIALSPWPERINVMHSSLQQFLPSARKKYDVIVSNPPFFSGTYKSNQNKRNISRHNEMLNFDELIEISSILMSDAGSLWVILPVRESLEFIRKSGSAGLFVHYMLRVIPKVGKAYNRVILQFKREVIPAARIETLTHWNADGSWTEEYKKFTGEFYVDF